ncbi:unnamed protein product [Somion occarium]|uniref:Uncharacterized protein n=2 Tax=Somion occarium TaxID=3059160 RepID=A0ABP1CGW8_9APHY
MSRTIPLPMGPHPGWELEESNPEDSPLHSVAESSVIAYALKQSRERWLTSTFPRFSVKTRGGKQGAILPPPHTIKPHGRFDLVVGPHVFSNTEIFEVHYLPQQASTSPSTASGQITRPSGTSNTASLSNPIPAPVMSTLPADAFVTPELISQVNSAAASNPVLSNLLHEVAVGRATQDQLKTLGLLIQTLKDSGAPQQTSTAPAAGSSSTPAQPSQIPTASRDFDIVLEFHEKPSDRWILPRGPVSIQPVRGHRGDDLIVNAVLPFTQTTTSNDDVNTKAKVPEIVAFRFASVSFTVHDLMMRWMGGPEKMAEHVGKLNEVASKWPKRQFLQHQLPNGYLLDQLKAAVAPPYVMKSIKPTHGDTHRSKRRATRKTTNIPPTPTPQIPISAPAPIPTPAPEQTLPVLQQEAPSASVDMPPPPKRKKSNNAKPQSSTTPTQIACHSCGQTDVPLMMGGRYCRPCIVAGKAVADIPSATPARAVERPPPIKAVSRRPSTMSAPTLVAHSPLATNQPVVFAPVQTPQNIGEEQKPKNT